MKATPRRRGELLRDLLGTMRFEGHGKGASFSPSLKTAAELHAKPEDNEGLIDHLRAIQGVVVAVFSKNRLEGKVRVEHALEIGRSRRLRDLPEVRRRRTQARGRRRRVRGTLAEVEEKVLKRDL